MMAFRNMRARGAMLLAGVAALLVAGAFAGIAGAKGGRMTVKSTHNTSLGETIATDSNGRTVYELSPETTHHLLCSSPSCFGFWPPVTVKSGRTKLHKATGIKGKLGILHRDGFFQVTLGGRPLYRFYLDSARGQANGQGIMTFGGTWHVVTASSHKSSSGSTTTGSTSAMPGW